MSSAKFMRRWAAAGALSLLVGCGPEVLDEMNGQGLLDSTEQEIVGGTTTTVAEAVFVQPVTPSVTRTV